MVAKMPPKARTLLVRVVRPGCNDVTGQCVFARCDGESIWVRQTEIVAPLVRCRASYRPCPTLDSGIFSVKRTARTARGELIGASPNARKVAIAAVN
jgi:hypothetical protein